MRSSEPTPEHGEYIRTIRGGAGYRLAPLDLRVTSSDSEQLIDDDGLSPSWRMAMTALNLYRDKRGSADVPRRVRAGGVSLGEWVARCRDDYWLGGVLSIEHTRELEAVETWSWGGATRPGTWRHAFDLLAEYSARRGGTTVLTEEITFDGVDLQAWAAAQRHAYAEGRMHHSSIQWLEGLSDWDWDADTARWIQGVTAAKQYVAHRGSIDSADRDTRVGAFRLGHWIQRCREDHRAATLPAERLAALEALPRMVVEAAEHGELEGRHACLAPLHLSHRTRRTAAR